MYYHLVAQIGCLNYAYSKVLLAFSCVYLLHADKVRITAPRRDFTLKTNEDNSAKVKIIKVFSSLNDMIFVEQ